MNKRIIAAALCFLLFAVSFTACRRQHALKEKDNTPKVDEAGFTLGEAGEKYITNINGDLIPVTTDKDGFMDLEDLRTKTAEQVQREKEQSSREQERTVESTRAEPTSTQTEPTGVVIGDKAIEDKSESDAVIQWPND